MVIARHPADLCPNMIDASSSLDRWVRSADAEAFNDLVRAYRPMVLGICQRVLGNCQAADDALQETFLQLSRQAHAIRSNLGSWLYTCALNEARRQRRMMNTRCSELDEQTPCQGHPTTDLDADEHQLLHTCIADLEDQDRDVISLHFFLGMPQAKIGLRYGISQPAVVKRLDRALRYLRMRIISRGLRLHGIFEASVPRFTSAFDWRMASLLIATAGYGIFPPSTIKQTYHLLRDGEGDAQTQAAMEDGLLSALCLLLTRRANLSGCGSHYDIYRASTHSRSQWFANRLMDLGTVLRESLLMTWYVVRDHLRRRGGAMAAVNLKPPTSRSIA
jgi:RNA polymerase sigma-70 factor, ECF subfamily